MNDLPPTRLVISATITKPMHSYNALAGLPTPHAERDGRINRRGVGQQARDHLAAGAASDMCWRDRDGQFGRPASTKR